MRIVLLGPLRSSFVQTDITELGREHLVIPIDSILGRGLAGAWSLLKLTIRTILALLRADMLYCWFADYHTVIPTLVGRALGKRVIVVAGGYDVGYLPEINYGARTRRLRWLCTRTTFRWASRVLPVSAYAERQLDLLTDGRHAPSTVVYNGVITDRFPNEITTEREPLAITVSQGDSITEYLRKRIDVFIMAAKAVPGVTFRVIGPSGPALERAYADADGIPNVEIIPGFVSLQDVIVPAFLKASCYCQLSYEETFGMAVVESMLCGCIPVTSAGGALPEVTGRPGLDVEQTHQLAAAISASTTAGIEERLEVRTYALRFTAEARGAILRSLLG